MDHLLRLQKKLARKLNILPLIALSEEVCVKADGWFLIVAATFPSLGCHVDHRLQQHVSHKVSLSE